ncbi:Scr1 family TA system antitoxin-like transcriptional regulator [Actinokineospora sp. G85]|uniref:Scr1 family TA system antitoxin-like transcriptional regulator n=1 Tax=Actinokineospora sp. G85 TaxID=3406626 RepID=UPI003C759530
MRIAKGYTTRALAKRVGVTPATLNRMMTGRRIASTLDIGGLCAILEVPKDRRPHLYALAAEAEQEDWLVHSTPKEPDPGGVIRSFWSLAHTVTTYSTVAATPVITGNSTMPPGSPLSTHPAFASWTHYVPQAALNQSFGEPNERLLRVAKSNNVRVIPETFRLPLRHPVQIFEFSHYPPVVLCDLEFGAVIIEKDRAACYVDRLTQAKKAALTLSESLELIRRAHSGSGGRDAHER